MCEQREGTRYCPAQLHGQCTQRALTGGRSQSLAGEGQRAGNRATHNAWPSCWSALPRPAMLRGNKPCTRPVARSYGRRGWRESPPVQVQGVCRQPRADGCRRPPAGALARFVPLRDRERARAAYCRVAPARGAATCVFVMALTLPHPPQPPPYAWVSAEPLPEGAEEPESAKYVKAPGK